MSKGRSFSFIWKSLLMVLLIAIGAASLFALSQSSLLAVEEITIDGNHLLTNEEVLAMSAPLLRGQSIILPPFDAAQGELENLPLVEGVEFERDFPNTIRIHIREYRPFVNLAAAGGKYFVLASDSQALMEKTTPEPGLPLLSTKTPCAAAVGARSECDDVMTGLKFLASIPVTFNYQFVEVSVDGGDIRAKTSTGVNVHFGNLNGYDLKFEVLRQLLARASAGGVQITIDVSVPERPVTKDETPPPAATVAEEPVPAAEAAATEAPATDATEAPADTPPATDPATAGGTDPATGQ